MFGRISGSGAQNTDRPGRSRLWRRAVLATVALALVGVAGFLVAASGVIPIKASSGHWAITRWFLQFAKQRSVATHSLSVESPPREEPWFVLKGAGHYEIGCRPCHGSPEQEHPRIAQHMTPPPPYLSQAAQQWERAELFYIVKHGIKFTGMPAWPAQQRDDEVWALVAFLRTFPDLDANEYRRLVDGDERATNDQQVVPLSGLEAKTASAPAGISNCARCHGAGGGGRESAAFPTLAAQGEKYLSAALRAYAQGKRHSGIMEPIAASLTSEQILEMSRYYAALPASYPSLSSDADAAAVERGAAIARQGLPAQEVPACADCHRPGDTPRNPMYPQLVGQHADYLALQLSLFKEDKRGGTAFAHLMRHVAGLTDEQINDVAQFYASLRDEAAKTSSPKSTTTQPE